MINTYDPCLNKHLGVMPNNLNIFMAFYSKEVNQKCSCNINFVQFHISFTTEKCTYVIKGFFKNKQTVTKKKQEQILTNTFSK